MKKIIKHYPLTGRLIVTRDILNMTISANSINLVKISLTIQDTRYFIFQIRAPGGHDTTFMISTYTINKVKYNNYLITINHVCHRLEQREVIQARLS